MRWPSRTTLGGIVPSQIRLLDVPTLQELSRRAAANHWGAGWPDWVRDHEDQIEVVYIRAWGPEGDADAYRCQVTAWLTTKAPRNFQMDVARKDLEALPALSKRELIALAHRLLERGPWIGMHRVSSTEYRFDDNLRAPSDE